MTLLVATPAASAHAILLRAEPAIGGVTPTPPDELLLQFTEPVEPKFSQIEVTDGKGPPPCRWRTGTCARRAPA